MSDDFSLPTTVTLRISRDLYEKLKLQLKMLKEHNVQGLEEAESVEDLIIFYLEHFSAGDEKMKQIEDRMQTVLDTLKDKGVDVLELLNSFSRTIKDEEQSEEKSAKDDKDTSSVKKKS